MRAEPHVPHQSRLALGNSFVLALQVEVANPPVQVVAVAFRRPLGVVGGVPLLPWEGEEGFRFPWVGVEEVDLLLMQVGVRG